MRSLLLACPNSFHLRLPGLARCGQRGRDSRGRLIGGCLANSETCQKAERSPLSFNGKLFASPHPGQEGAGFHPPFWDRMAKSPKVSYQVLPIAPLRCLFDAQSPGLRPFAAALGAQLLHEELERSRAVRATFCIGARQKIPVKATTSKMAVNPWGLA
jgi:hypothetical protein